MVHIDTISLRVRDQACWLVSLVTWPILKPEKHCYCPYRCPKSRLGSNFRLRASKKRTLSIFTQRRWTSLQLADWLGKWGSCVPPLIFTPEILSSEFWMADVVMYRLLFCALGFCNLEFSWCFLCREYGWTVIQSWRADHAEDQIWRQLVQGQTHQREGGDLPK